jgi:hypothetical protein
MAVNPPEISPAGTGGGGIPKTIAGIPTPVVLLGVGGIVALILILRSRGSGSTTTTTPVTEPTGGGGGGTTTTPAPTLYTNASILAMWIKATAELAKLTTDPNKIRARIGANWEDIAQYLITNPNVFTDANSDIRAFFQNIPAASYNWVVHISTLYTEAKQDLAADVSAGGGTPEMVKYFTFLPLSDLVNYLRANPAFVEAHPQYKELVTLPIVAASSGG